MPNKRKVIVKFIVIIYLFILALIIEGWLVKSFYHNSDRFIKFQNIAVFLANLPSKVKNDILSINKISTDIQKITPDSYSQPSRFHFDYNQKKKHSSYIKIILTKVCFYYHTMIQICKDLFFV